MRCRSPRPQTQAGMDVLAVVPSTGDWRSRVQSASQYRRMCRNGLVFDERKRVRCNHNRQRSPRSKREQILVQFWKSYDRDESDRANCVSRDQESRSRSSRRSARSRSLKSHSDHCAWSKISNDGMSEKELIDVRKMVIFGGCLQTVRRGRRRGFMFPQVMVKLVEVVRAVPVDTQVPSFGRNRRRR